MLFFILLITLLALFLSLKTYTISGSSMEPTLSDKSRVWVMQGKPESPLRGIRRNSIAQYYHEELVVKRCVALPGDPISLEGTMLHLEDRSYQLTRSVADSLRGVTTIPEGYYFFVGDNLSESRDSRHYGLIPKEDIYGRVWSFQGL